MEDLHRGDNKRSSRSCAVRRLYKRAAISQTRCTRSCLAINLRGIVAEWFARRTRDLEVAGFDSRQCHVAIALGKQFTLTFPSPPTCKMGTQLRASIVLVCWDISGAALWRHS
ncbi:hypothetical protein ElyMa_001469000 [Elysia marginata]|uniref:Uncharacterized protein n=1 Tax=Elysia marginata TaxID=1093978 RepID=A0AAV4J6T9_9GAST|nr:hypothetical protein ElyMa_001469000 [Elysia marginata]